MSSGQEIFYICLFHAIRTIQDMADVLVRSRSTIFPKTPVSTMTRITRKFGLQNDMLNLPKGILSNIAASVLARKFTQDGCRKCNRAGSWVDDIRGSQRAQRRGCRRSRGRRGRTTSNERNSITRGNGGAGLFTVVLLLKCISKEHNHLRFFQAPGDCPSTSLAIALASLKNISETLML